MENDDFWKNYRLGDIINYWWSYRKEERPYAYSDSVCNTYPGSIGAEYLRINKQISGKRERNFKLFFAIIENRLKNEKLSFIPHIHLRMGDGIKSYNDGGFQYFMKYTITLQQIQEIIKELKSNGHTQIYAYYGIHNGKKIKESKIYLDIVRKMFKEADINFVEKNSGNPDTDFLKMCNSKTLYAGGGRYSWFINCYRNRNILN